MTSCQYQQALAKPLFALLTVTLLAISGCSDKPQNGSSGSSSTNDAATVDNSQSSTATQSAEVSTEPTSEAVTDTSSQTGTDATLQNAESATTTTTTTSNEPDSSLANEGTNDGASADTISEQPDAALSANAGKELYEKQCKICHESGLLNAPKYGDKAAWQPHISKGMATLYEHSAKGFNKMPPQAVNGVTDAQVHAAVDYMVAGSS